MPAPWRARLCRAAAAALAALALGAVAHARPLSETGAAAAAGAASLVSSPSADVSTVPAPSSSSIALCFDIQALHSLEGHNPSRPNALVDYDGVLRDYYVYISTSIALAFVIIFIMIVAVCLRDHRAGKKKPEDDEVPLAHLSASSPPELRSSASRDAPPRDPPRHRFIRVPRRIPPALRKRRISRMHTGSRSSSSGGTSQPAAGPSSAPPSAAPSPLQTTTTPNPAAPLDTPLAELGPRVEQPPTSPRAAVPPLHLPPPAPAAPTAVHAPRGPLRAPLSQSDVEAVDALPIEPAQPPAYIAPPPADAQPGASPRADRGKGPAPPPEEAGGTDELFAHLATDDKAVLTALHSAASAPAPALDADPLRPPPLAPPPLAPPPRWGAAPSAPPIDVDEAIACDAPPTAPPGKGKARHVSGSLSLPPAHRTPQFARFDAPTYEAPAPSPSSAAKEAEAETERAQLAALLPSAPTEWAWSDDALPTYGTAPSAPPAHDDDDAVQAEDVPGDDPIGNGAYAVAAQTLGTDGVGVGTGVGIDILCGPFTLRSVVLKLRMRVAVLSPPHDSGAYRLFVH
ncbi:hypothetical protein MBRA1_003264 [Malassezia brasiliensis]|uniref:Uncharacterized protein n=1 Tax=Malassezia brasiliensis TaxID=1821822 RepID=A0AAF0IU59_9BASI|nr:hypothetical protein MBRA1_003264 [Malassezia brasiliensis]